MGWWEGWGIGRLGKRVRVWVLGKRFLGTGIEWGWGWGVGMGLGLGMGGGYGGGYAMTYGRILRLGVGRGEMCWRRLKCRAR